jgi:7-cyano-7-deazaguanine synthase
MSVAHASSTNTNSSYATPWAALNEAQRATVRRLLPPNLLQLTGKAIALVSGGLDSTVGLYALKAMGVDIALALHVNYGQQAYAKEAEAVSQLCMASNTPLKTIELSWLTDLLPKGMQQEATHAQQQELSDVWVPNRNGVLLNIAASYAEAHGAKYVSFGANADEAQAFSDNSEDYWQWVNRSLRLSTQNGVQILAPTGPLSKQAIVELGEALQVPFEYLWSCYSNGDTHCGTCTSCTHLKRGLGASSLAQTLVKINS